MEKSSIGLTGVTFKGITPQNFSDNKIREFIAIANEEAVQLESELVSKTPANFGRLKGGWVLTPATSERPKAIINQSVSYFLPVEMGRAPGKGISKEGQTQVKRWAKLVMGLKNQKSKGSVEITQSTFAYLLSRKYKREGRPAVGFVGLAKEGAIPSSGGGRVPENPVGGSILDLAFKRIRARVNRL